jgi:peroxiredoxin (alkyl hydroperoxide reductase subunit C)
MAAQVGDQAPDFTAKATEKREITLSSYRGRKNVVLAFFPFVFSPVCSEQIPAYSQNIERFRALETEVLGVSVDSHWAQGAWVKAYGIQIPVVSDFSKEIARSYGALHPGGMTQRAIVIIDKKGKITCRKVEEDLGQVPDLEQIFAELKKLPK